MSNPNPKTEHLIPTQWPKGYCPNPTGRRGKKKPLTEAYEDEVRRRATEIAKAMVDAACGDPEAKHVNVFAAQELANRVEGKVVEKLELSSDQPFALDEFDAALDLDAAAAAPLELSEHGNGNGTD